MCPSKAPFKKNLCYLQGVLGPPTELNQELISCPLTPKYWFDSLVYIQHLLSELLNGMNN